METLESKSGGFRIVIFAAAESLRRNDRTVKRVSEAVVGGFFFQVCVGGVFPACPDLLTYAALQEAARSNGQQIQQGENKRRNSSAAEGMFS